MSWEWVVPGGNWPVIPKPDDYPSDDEIYDALADMEWPTEDDMADDPPGSPLRAWKHGRLWEQNPVSSNWIHICVSCHKPILITDVRGRAVCDACIARVPEEWMS